MHTPVQTWLLGASIFLAACSGGAKMQPDAGGGGTDGGSVICKAPVLEGTPAVSIAGTWDFTPQAGARTQIQVPGGGWFKQGFNIPSATYETSITVPDLGRPQTTLLELGAVNHEATLSVDGAVVGTNTTSFTPSVFDITGFVTPGGTHAISLVVKGRKGLLNAAGRKNVPDAAGWSANVPQGIFRSAMVRVYPDVYVSDVFVRPDVAGDTLSYDVTVANTGATDRQLTLSGSLDSWNCDPLLYPVLPDTSVTIPAGQSLQISVGPVSWGLGPASYWWPNVPYRPDYTARLHYLRVALRDGATLVHERLVRFGFRDITQAHATPQNTYYFLNGVRVNLRGDNLQGADYDSIVTDGGPGDAYDTWPGFLAPDAGNPGWPQAVRNYQQLNYNVIRIHQELAAPYMLDVADELGLMLIDETAIRGSNSDQDFMTGHDNMVNHARALVLRDRNHPSVVRWSQSNEASLSSTDSPAFENDLYSAIVALDPTRPVSTDGSDVYDAMTYPNFSAFPHYLGGLGVYTDTVLVRSDRPFGQGEFIWPSDVTPQGLMWFATSTVAMRSKDASEIRPYALLSGWASVIPGVTTDIMLLEPTYPARVINPPLFGEDNLPDPWSNPILMRIQRAFNPLLVADSDYWAANHLSDTSGDWPVNVPALTRDSDVTRNLVMFNDTFSDTGVDITWELRADAPDGAIASSASIHVDIPLGALVSQAIQVHTPASGTTAYLVLRAQKNGETLFEDAATQFTLN